MPDDKMPDDSEKTAVVDAVDKLNDLIEDTALTAAVDPEHVAPRTNEQVYISERTEAPVPAEVTKDDGGKETDRL